MPKSDKELAVELTTAWLSHNSVLVNSGLSGNTGGSRDKLVDKSSVASAYLYFLDVVEEGRLSKADK